MHPDVLIQKQQELIPLICRFSDHGGTAIALQIGHRRSIDFDLFTRSDIHRNQIQNQIRKSSLEIQDVLYEAFDQFHCLVNDVKLTFLSYPFDIGAPLLFAEGIHIPALSDLGAMKAYALGGRGKWKDYVDLYFLFKYHFTLQEIENRAQTLFGSVFNEKLFREQLAFFEDIDYSEEVELISETPTQEEIRSFLTEIALTEF